jgi:hypothetical protein
MKKNIFDPIRRTAWEIAHEAHIHQRLVHTLQYRLNQLTPVMTNCYMTNNYICIEYNPDITPQVDTDLETKVIGTPHEHIVSATTLRYFLQQLPQSQTDNSSTLIERMLAYNKKHESLGVAITRTRRQVIAWQNLNQDASKPTHIARITQNQSKNCVYIQPIGQTQIAELVPLYAKLKQTCQK